MTRRIPFALVGLAVCACAPSLGLAQEKCYRDAAGRVFNRQLPGFEEVPCDQPQQPRQTPDTSVMSPGETAQPDVPSLSNRKPPASISPIPIPRGHDGWETMAIPDRWRIVDSLPGYRYRLWDPYNRNVLKADKPVHGDDWFFNLGLISDSVYELRDLPTPVGGATSGGAGSNDVFGATDQWVFSQNIAAEFVYYQGDTVFKPPEYEFRLTPVLNLNYVSLEEVLGVNADPGRGRTRKDYHIGIQAAFIDKHLRDVSSNYDFDSIRVGIQPFSSDFRGFLFQDNQLGVRLFGTRRNNVFQYNLAWFRRLEKDTNSGLNDVSQRLRDDDVFVANLYWQDMPVRGFTSQATVLYNRNREGSSSEAYYNKNGFIERPSSLGREIARDYDVTYLGYNGDGHFGRYNLTTSLYYAIGEETPGTFVSRDVDVRAWFAAAELSRDFDWLRARLSVAYGSGDDDPFDDRATAFDAVFENPQFAGADTSYWIRQAVPLVAGGRVTLAGRNALLNSLRSSKEEGQSNFTNPGVALAGIGLDADLLPTLRLSFNVNALFFADTTAVEVARNQGNIDRHIGEDVSASLIWRPLMSQNMVLRASYARLIAGEGFDALFPDEDPGYFMLNAIFAY